MPFNCHWKRQIGKGQHFCHQLPCSVQHDVPVPPVWWWFQSSQVSRTVTMTSVWSCLEVMVAKEPHSHHHLPLQVAALKSTWMVSCSFRLKPQHTLVSLPHDDKLLNDVAGFQLLWLLWKKLPTICLCRIAAQILIISHYIFFYMKHKSFL